MIDLPAAGEQSALIGCLFYLFRWIDRKSPSPTRRSIREENDLLDARLSRIEATNKWLGDNKASSWGVQLLEERFDERLSKLEDRLGIKRGI